MMEDWHCKREMCTWSCLNDLVADFVSSKNDPHLWYGSLHQRYSCKLYMARLRYHHAECDPHYCPCLVSSAHSHSRNMASVPALPAFDNTLGAVLIGTYVALAFVYQLSELMVYSWTPPGFTVSLSTRHIVTSDCIPEIRIS